MAETPTPERQPVTDKHHASNGNGNGQAPKSARGLAPMWQGPVHFVLASAEATMVLPAETPVDVDQVVIQQDPQSPP
jgi:hypothetical protein